MTLRPQVTVRDGDDLQLAQQLHEKAHHLCFIANSVNFPVACGRVRNPLNFLSFAIFVILNAATARGWEKSLSAAAAIYAHYLHPNSANESGSFIGAAIGGGIAHGDHGGVYGGWFGVVLGWQTLGPWQRAY